MFKWQKARTLLYVAGVLPLNRVSTGLNCFHIYVPPYLRASAALLSSLMLVLRRVNHRTRCEETRTREAWLFQRRLEETARGEELVRMRAEERFTRALLDLELQDLQRLERARREAEETLRMRSEDQVMRNLRRLEQAQVAEREAMRVEDELARTRKQTEE